MVVPQTSSLLSTNILSILNFQQYALFFMKLPEVHDGAVHCDLDSSAVDMFVQNWTLARTNT
jgi:hypothetical protein